MAMSTTSAVVTLPPAHLRFPVEIIDHITQYLSSRDCKSLRQTCKFFAENTTRSLFRSICLSKTKLDRDNFLNIANTPHLAHAVREIIWYELAENEETFRGLAEDLAEYHSKLPRNLRSEDNDQPLGLPDFAGLTADAIWLHIRRTRDDRKHPWGKCNKNGAKHDDWKELAKHIFAALEKMPNVHTFGRLPMPPRHVITYAGYPITAQLLQQGVVWPGSKHTHSYMCDDGFCAFLLPAIGRLQSRVEHLSYVAHEDFIDSLCFCGFQGHFLNLKRIAICVGCRFGLIGALNWWFRDPVLRDLHDATSLEEFHFCFGHGRTVMNLDTHDLFFPFGDYARSFPSLRRLELSDLSMGIESGQSKDLVGFIGTLPTLRYLALHRCGIRGSLVTRLRHIESLTLESLQVTEHGDKDTLVVDESALVAYVNGRGPIPEDLAGAPEVVFCTSSTRDSITCRTRAYTHQDELARPTPLECADTNNYRGDKFVDDDITVVFEEVSRYRTIPNREYVEVRLAEVIPDPRNIPEMRVRLSSASIMDSRAWSVYRLFIHHDGRKAIGCEPLEYFSDWEDDDDDDQSYDGSDDDAEVDSQAGFGDSDISDEDDEWEEDQDWEEE